MTLLTGVYEIDNKELNPLFHFHFTEKILYALNVTDQMKCKPDKNLVGHSVTPYLDLCVRRDDFNFLYTVIYRNISLQLFSV